ncbi:MAG: hypothetical protein LBM06_06780 [Prevotellaceae bacterium]|jgi:hypothetical protein|nr:hypothetical protein [Prevotellaceae bacterium]
MKSKFNIILLGVLLIAILSNLFVFLYQKNNKNSFAPNLLSACAKARAESILLKEGFFHMYDFEKLSINASTPVQNGQGIVMPFKDAIAEENKLLLFVQPTNCLSCVSENINAITSSALKNKVVICVNGLGESDFKIFAKKHNIVDNAYRIPDSFFQGFAIQPVIFCVIDAEDHSLHFFYSPSIHLPEITTLYLDRISPLFKDKKHLKPNAIDL